jgi:predicted RNase H-like nuclease
MPWVAGLDGCKTGWYAVLAQYQDNVITELRFKVCPEFKSVYSLDPRPAVVTVDIPIGLLDERVTGGRECDKLARRRLGQPRGTSVFPPPIRRTLSARSYEEAKQLNGGMSIQSFGILPKIHEVDSVVTPEFQNWIYEIHPELCFWAISGNKPMKHKKRASDGQDERVEALQSVSSWAFQETEKLLRRRPSGAAVDDVLDACAAAWTAIRIAEGTAQRIPTAPPLDSKGLRMEMWY